MVKVAGICRDINWPDGLRGEVMEEIEAEDRMLQRLSQPKRGVTAGYFLVVLLIIIAIVIIFLIPVGVLAWFIVAFLLYSFNFIILFLPTTRKGKKDDSCRRTINRDSLEPIKYLLKKKKKLAIEVGLTMFLGGMVPLALSFFVIFGIGLILAVYFTYLVQASSEDISIVVMVQVLVIIIFFAVLVLTRPDAQGFTRIARSFKTRYNVARTRSRWYRGSILIMMGLTAAGIGMLLVGAILLTGGVLGEVIDVGSELGVSLLLLLLVFVVELVVMRHFQVVSSRRMARTLLENRLQALREDVLKPLYQLLEQGKFADEERFDKKKFEQIKSNFFNIVIYQVFELNFFGYSPIYIVGPNVKYLIDDRVLPYVGGS